MSDSTPDVELPDLEKDIPDDSEDEIVGALRDLLPDKSRGKYERAWADFMTWIQSKKYREDEEPKEKLYLLYFSELNTRLAPTTLWTLYSMGCNCC